MYAIGESLAGDDEREEMVGRVGRGTRGLGAEQNNMRSQRGRNEVVPGTKYNIASARTPPGRIPDPKVESSESVPVGTFYHASGNKDKEER
jgi:hypothetical protein